MNLYRITYSPGWWADEGAATAAQAFNSYSHNERKAIQRSLRSYGYYSGGIDGSFGPGTYNAISAYARASGASGNLNTTGGAYALYDGLIFFSRV